MPSMTKDYVLEFRERGALSNLRFGTTNRKEADTSEALMAEVTVHASALNFRDVLNVLGMYPGDPGLMGLEFAGRITGGKSRFELGDGVMGLGAGGFSGQAEYG